MPVIVSTGQQGHMWQARPPPPMAQHHPRFH